MNRLVSLPLLVSLLLLAACSGKPDSTEPDAADIALNNRGVALMGYFDYPGAYAAFSELVERRPQWHDARINLAVALMNRQQPGDEQRALEQLDIVIAAAPDRLRAHYVAGLLRLYVGDVEAAAQHFSSVLADDPADAYVHYYLGQSLQRGGDSDAALQYFLVAIETDPYLRSAYYAAAQLLQQIGRDDEAREQLALFERLANNPRARLAEFKYTRMGPKSFAATSGVASRAPSPAPPPDGYLFEGPRTVSLTGALPRNSHITTVDIDGDTVQELFIAGANGNRVLKALADSGFADHETQPFATTTNINAAAWGDIDNNGFVDVYLCRNGPNELWLQHSRNEWHKAGDDVADGDRDCADSAMVDADHDGDLDILIANRGAGNELLNNNRDGTFRSLSTSLGAAASPADTHRVLTADFDGDRDVDLLFINEQPPHVALANDRIWNYTSMQGMQSITGTRLSGATVVDVDADGLVELIGATPDGQLQTWRSGATGNWGVAATSESSIAAAAPVDLASLDISGDGDPELIVLAQGAFEVRVFDRNFGSAPVYGADYEGSAAIPVVRSVARGPSLISVDTVGDATLLTEWTPGTGRHEFIALTLSGAHDDAETMRSNASGIGTFVALRNGTHWSLADTLQTGSLRGQSLQPLAIGLRSRQRADFIALQWSDGVFQTELNLDSGVLHRIGEVERQLSSCPVLFAWNGDQFEFVTDLLGVGGLGGFVEPGVVGTPRPWERLLLTPGTLEARDGRLQLKLTEPMQESAYVDAASLEYYDLPQEWQVVIDERMGTAAPEVTGEVLFFRDAALPVAARDSDDKDVLALVSERDQLALQPGVIDRRFIGLLENEQTLTLEFAEPLDAKPGRLPVLVADAWVEYPYSQTVFSAWQAGEQYHSASLEIRDGSGKWHMAYPEFGYPAGMPREMALPLYDLPPGSDALRLRWNRELYWDRLRVVFAEPPPATMRHGALQPALARVMKTGFAKRTTHSQRRPHYDYAARVPFWDTTYATGYYTTLGTMTELVTSADDALAIIGPGEEIHFEFDAAPAPDELRRWYVLDTRGWAKDQDFYTHEGGTVGPLPSAHANSVESVRDSLHERFNTRFQAGR